MPHRSPAQQRGSIGGLIRAATAADSRDITAAARDARFRQYLDQVPGQFTDPADRMRRAELLRRADMTRMSLKATKARKLKAELRAIEQELTAAGLDDAGSDGVDADG